jgi:hypothetical protein
MKKLILFCANGAIAIWFIILWLYKMLLSSDIPMSIPSCSEQFPSDGLQCLQNKTLLGREGLEYHSKGQTD